MCLCLYNASDIFPIMSENEYFVDKDNFVHNKNCPINSVPWFQTKWQKYDFLAERSWTFCSYCIDTKEQAKLICLHNCNLNIRIGYLRAAGAPNEYIYKFKRLHDCSKLKENILEELP